MKRTESWLKSSNKPLKIALTSGASCPDILVDEVLLQILDYFEGTKEVNEVIAPFEEKLEPEEA
jgi:4-hydroxy-3-methylbut-2-enyl diphosphate reductase